MSRERTTRRAPRRLVRIVAPVLVGAALASLATIAVANQLATARLDQEQSLVQLDELQRSRTRAITDGIDRLRTSVSLLAADRAVVTALLDLRAGAAELDEAVAAGDTLLEPAEEEALLEVLVDLLDDESLQRALLEAGLPTPSVEELLPSDETARYLQHRYLRFPRPVPGAPDPATATGPGTAYARAHQEHAPILERLGGAFSDLWLVDLEGDRVLHTVTGGPELGTDATEGTLGASVVGRLLEFELRRTTAGEVAISDVGPYLGGPSMFMAEAVRDGSEIIGAVVVRIPVDLLDSLMTAQRRWTEVGLGDTGETYVVGRDQRLRSSARRHVEDPAAHLEALRARGDDELADLVGATRSTVLVTPVETRPVRTALDGRRFSGRAAGLDADDTLTVASPLGVTGLDWVVVAQIDRREAMAESSQQLTRQLVLAALLLPAVAAVGVLLAWYLVRPIRPLVAATERVAAGARESGLTDLSRDEFGHLARELDRAAGALVVERARLATEHEAIDALLLASLPARAVEAVRSGRPDLAATIGLATVVAIGIDAGNPDPPDIPAGTDGHLGAGDAAAGHPADDQGADGEAADGQRADGQRVRSEVDAGELDLDQLVDRHDEVATSVAQLAEAVGAERIRASGDRLLYVVGLGADDDGSDAALRFATDVAATHADVHVAMASGPVTCGVVGGIRPVVTLWGTPVRAALSLLARGHRGELLRESDLGEQRPIGPATVAP